MALTEQDEMVSVWLWLGGSQRQLDTYLRERHGDDDRPMSKFAVDLGVDFYDHDVQECVTRRAPAPVATVIDGASWSASYRDAVVAAAKRRGIAQARGHLVLFDHVYRGPWPSASPLTFVGAFPLDRDAASRTDAPEEPERRPGDHREHVSALAISADGRSGATGDGAGEVALWDLTRGTCVARSDGAHQHGVRAAAFAPNGQLVTTGSEIVVWRRAGAQLRARRLGSDQAPMYALAMEPRGGSAIAVSDVGVVRRWRLAGGRAQVLHRIDTQTRVMRVALGDDGTVLTRTEDGAALAWRDGVRRWGLDGDQTWTSALAVVGGRAVLARGRRLVAVDLATGDELASTAASADRLVAAPGGTSVVLASGRRIGTWDLRGKVAWVAAHGQDVTDVAVSSSLILSVGEDGAARLWSGSLAPRGRFDGAGSLVRCAGSRDGTRWLVGGDDGQVHVLAWNGRALRALR